MLKSVGSAKTLAKARSAGELSEWLVQGRNLPLGISPASLSPGSTQTSEWSEALQDPDPSRTRYLCRSYRHTRASIRTMNVPMCTLQYALQYAVRMNMSSCIRGGEYPASLSLLVIMLSCESVMV